jgi:hypothetical protein
MQLVFQIITDDFLGNLRALLLEIQRLASAALEAGFEILAALIG